MHINGGSKVICTPFSRAQLFQNKNREEDQMITKPNPLREQCKSPQLGQIPLLHCPKRTSNFDN